MHSHKSRVSFRLAPACLMFCLAAVPATADTITISNGTNGTLGTAQSVSVDPDLIVLQVPPNFTLASAQPVSPEYMASDVLGSITNTHTQEFFSFAVTQGDNISLVAAASVPATQFPELLLYDNNGNLVAVAAANMPDGSSARIDFTIPSGSSGNWSAEVVGSPAAPDPGTNFFNYNLRLSGSAINYKIDVLGALTDPSKHGFYAIGTNVGDNLSLLVSAADPSTQFPELFLYDELGNLVAVANGNASDGSSSRIDFTIPGGEAGNWFAEVAGSPGVPDPSTNLFSYDLQIQGATGTGPVDPLASLEAVPEPSTFALVSISMAGLGLIRRRRPSQAHPLRSIRNAA
jgi:hypothetical protein